MFISNQDRDALYKHITDLLTETPRGLRRALYRRCVALSSLHL